MYGIEKPNGDKICPKCDRKFPAASNASICPDDKAALLSDTETLIGTVIQNRYEVIAFVGFGGWSKVYKAKDLTLDKVVAVKILHTDLAKSIDKFKRFQQEARAQANLVHVNIVSIFDHGLMPSGVPFLAMDYVDGQTLTQLLRVSGPLPVNRALDIIWQIGSALQAAHERGIIHRDLKPQNILIVPTSSDMVKVLDFGLPNLVSDEGTAHSITESGETLGTPAYMSPEQCRGKPLDARSDIYALGCVMYEILSGTPAVRGSSPSACLQAHLNETPERFDQVLPGNTIPDELEAMVFKALEKNVDNRYSTVRDLLFEIGELSTSETINQSKFLGAATERFSIAPKKRRNFITGFADWLRQWQN